MFNGQNGQLQITLYFLQKVPNVSVFLHLTLFVFFNCKGVFVKWDKVIVSSGGQPPKGINLCNVCYRVCVSIYYFQIIKLWQSHFMYKNRRVQGNIIINHLSYPNPNISLGFYFRSNEQHYTPHSAHTVLAHGRHATPVYRRLLCISCFPFVFYVLLCSS